MKILTFNWHTPYLSLLAKNERHQFDVGYPNVDYTPQLSTWDHTMRPLPANVEEVSADEVTERLRDSGFYDLILCHNVKDLVALQEYNHPKILIFHNKLSTEAALGGDESVIADYRQMVRGLVSGVYCVFIAQTKRHDWGLPGDVIMPGIDVADYGGYNGNTPCVLRVGNSIRARALMTGYAVQQEALDGVPNLLLGANPDIPGCHVSKDWDELRQAYRDNRLFLNTGMAPYEDGYNLALHEAMATGMPVVSIANPTTPITLGVDGLIGENAAQLKDAALTLLRDHDRAREIGAAGALSVERLFPISRFLQKWDDTFYRAREWAPGPPKMVFGFDGPGVTKVAFETKEAAHKNVILSYTAYPATAAAYMESALRRRHSVITAGGKVTPEIATLWGLQNMREPIISHDIDSTELTLDIDYLNGRLYDPANADLFIYIDTGLGKAPEGLHKLAMPKIAYLIDTHLHHARHLRFAKEFDAVFLAQRAYIESFREHGVENVFWLPLGCDPKIHGKVDLPREHEVGFVGSLTDQRRIELLMKIAERTDVRYERLFLREMGDFFCRSKIVFNNAIKNDLNMRVFEAMASGALLLTDPADGLTDFFTDREHMVMYDEENVGDLARYYCDHNQEREKIAAAGREEVLKKHTYQHRVDELIKVCAELFGF